MQSPKHKIDLNQNLPGRVYYISCQSDDTVLVGMDIAIRMGTVRWFDTVKERAMEIEKIVENSQSGFAFERKGGGVYTFVPMTLEVYEDKVKRHLISPPDAFNSLDDLIKSFEKTKEKAW